MTCKLKMKGKTCMHRNGVFSWKIMFQEFARIIDCDMKGKVDNAAQICVSVYHSKSSSMAGNVRQMVVAGGEH